MKTILLILSAAVMVLTSCQKEPSFEDPNSIPGGAGGGTGGTSVTKLIRTGTRAGSDTVTTNYTYNTANSIVRFIQSGIISGSSFTAEVRYVRNAANIITSNIIKNDALVQFGLDSIETFHTYDAANSRYKYSLAPITVFGATETDSIVYVYTAGKLSAAIDYYNDGSGYVPYSKEEYAYNGGNLSEVRSYSYNDQTSSYDLDQTVTYEYDVKTNPTQFASDAAVMSMVLYYSANNETKRTVVENGNTTVVTTAVSYNSNNRPVTAITSSGGAVTSSSNYTYQ